MKGTSVAEIFEHFGESVFREKEVGFIPCVLQTGVPELVEYSSLIPVAAPSSFAAISNLIF